MSKDKYPHPFVPLVPPARYNKNFLRQAVCELRFPVLFDLNTSVPDLDFARSIKKAYPHHSHQINETQVNGDAIERTHIHIFKSKNLDWSISLRQSALTIETTKYTSFEEFKSKIEFIVDASSKIIDSDFFTRIGLRYINTIPMNLVDTSTENFKGWVRDSLVSALVNEDIGLLNEYNGRLAGEGDFGNFSFQHGVGIDQKSNDPEYYLDFDFSKNNVEMCDVLDTIEKLHENQFSMFIWSLGPRAKDFLGDSILKET